MKQIARIGLVAISVAFCARADVLTNTWVAGSTDWNAEASYLENRVPSAGDVVVIPSGVTATVSVVSTEAANTEGSSFDVFSKLYAVITEDATSSVVLDMGEGVSVTNGCRIYGKTGGQGTIIKRGLGMIEFGAQASLAYNLNMTVEEGVLVMPQELPHPTLFYLYKLIVNKGASFITAMNADRKGDLSSSPTLCTEMWGAGAISNRYGLNQRLDFRTDGKAFTFDGILGRGLRFFPHARVDVMLTGTNSTLNGTVEVNMRSTIGFTKMGTSGQPSSLGTSGALNWRGTSGTFLYLGEGETSNKNVTDNTGADNVENIFDAGATGGLTLTGTVGYYTSDNNSARMKRITLTGSNTVPCVFSGTLADVSYSGTNYGFHITKKGSGTWRFADKAQTRHASAWTVEDGTLQFESLKQRGTACSLGTSTNLLESYTGKIDESKRVDWAFALGGTTTKGTMEYVGTNNATCSTRPLALKGMGGTFASSSNAVMRFYGAYAESGVDAALTLAGDATVVTNVIGDISDGKGRLSLVKEGEGTWSLFGTNNTFSGSLAVKKGTLIVNNPANYSWFRFSVTQSFAPENDGNRARAQASELGIWDENNQRINARLYPYTNYWGKAEGSLPEGMCAYWRSGTMYDTYSGNSIRPLEGLFDVSTPLVTGNNSYMSPKFTVGGNDVYMTPDDPSTWMPIVMHLTNGIGRAASFDLVLCANNTTRNVKSFIMEGSLDGIHWDSLTNIVLETNVGNKWMGSGASYSAGNSDTHTGGWPLAGGPEVIVPALANVSSVSVAENARLVAVGPVAPLKGLSVDASGAGTIDGFAFAGTGTLNVENLPDDGATLPGTYLNSTGLDKVADWSLKVGGEDTKRYRIAYSNGVIQIRPVGTVLLLR